MVAEIGAVYNAESSLRTGTELTQIKRHRGRAGKGEKKDSLPDGKKTPKRKRMYLQRTTERMVQLEKLKQRYVKRGKEGKSRLLDEFCEHYGYERKDAIKLLGGGLAVPQSQRRSGANVNISR